MISEFIQEQKRYTQKQLCEILQEKSEDKIVHIIKKLKEYGILKVVKATKSQKNMSDLDDVDIEVTEVEYGEDKLYYVFTFVGIIIIAGKVLKCYPKYILENKEPLNELKQVIHVLEKYNSKEQIIHMFNGESDAKSFNLLAMQLYLLNDYYENGLYTNLDDIIETNGTGEILWNKTINETFALINNNRPYYIELQTKKNVENETEYFNRLHKCILSMISKELQEADLLDIFEITEVELSDEELDDFGDVNYQLYRIENELNTQFNTRKQLLLKAIYTYVNRSGNLNDIECISMFGTNSFNLVWEGVCADILDNKLNMPVSNLNLKYDKKEKNNKLIDYIEKPYWSIPNKTAKETLIPDIVSIIENNEKKEFIIFDAKYYNIDLQESGVLKGVPGIESITKQYLYQLAYQEFILKHGIDSVINCFLMPTEKSEVQDKGYVSLSILDKLGLEKIQVRMLPAKEAYTHYLKGTKLDVSDYFETDANSP